MTRGQIKQMLRPFGLTMFVAAAAFGMLGMVDFGITALGLGGTAMLLFISSSLRHLELRAQNFAEHNPHVVAETVRAYAELVSERHPMPPTGGWAATAESVVSMVDLVMSNENVKNIVECGSGASTVWFAYACKERGFGHVTSLEHDAEYAEVTRSYLTRHGLEDWATVVNAPLVETSFDGQKSQVWYSLEGLDPSMEIDLVFVDGPPATTASLARLPAYFAFGGRLSDHSWVILDDTDRPQEKKIVDEWVAHSGARRLHVDKVVSRTTFLRHESNIDVAVVA